MIYIKKNLWCIKKSIKMEKSITVCRGVSCSHQCLCIILNNQNDSFQIRPLNNIIVSCNEALMF